MQSHIARYRTIRHPVHERIRERRIVAHLALDVFHPHPKRGIDGVGEALLDLAENSPDLLLRHGWCVANLLFGRGLNIDAEFVGGLQERGWTSPRWCPLSWTRRVV